MGVVLNKLTGVLQTDRFQQTPRVSQTLGITERESEGINGRLKEREQIQNFSQISKNFTVRIAWPIKRSSSLNSSPPCHLYVCIRSLWPYIRRTLMSKSRRWSWMDGFSGSCIISSIRTDLTVISVNRQMCAELWIGSWQIWNRRWTN